MNTSLWRIFADRTASLVVAIAPQDVATSVFESVCPAHIDELWCGLVWLSLVFTSEWVSLITAFVTALSLLLDGRGKCWEITLLLF